MQETTTNLVNLSGFDKLKAQITVFVGPTKDISITDQGTMIMAQGAMKTLNDFKKQIENARVAAKQPHLDASRQIDAYAKEIAEPLEQAIDSIKGKVVEYTEAENKRRAEEQRKIEEERRAAERKAEEERQRIAAEARKKAEEEAAALKKKQEEERKRFEAEQKKKAEALKAFGVDEAKAKAEKEAAEKAMKEKSEAERQAQARRAEEERIEAEARADRERKAREDELKAKEKALKAEAPKGTRQVAKWRVVDPSKVPDKYWIINEAAIGVDVRAGERNIPGVEIVMETVAVAR